MPRDPEKSREYQRKYAQSDKRKATRRRYNQSEKGRARNNAQCARWRAANPEKMRLSYKKHDLKRHYGMTVEEFNELLKSQDYKCAVCRTAEPTKIGWVVDHCHNKNHVRGILCSHCNTALGQAKDNPATLRALADYLERGLV